MPIRPYSTPPWLQILRNSASSTGQAAATISDTLTEQRRQRLADDKLRTDMLNNAFQFTEEQRITNLREKELQFRMDRYNQDAALDNLYKKSLIENHEETRRQNAYENLFKFKYKPLMDELDALKWNPSPQAQQRRAQIKTELERIRPDFTSKLGKALEGVDPNESPAEVETRVAPILKEADENVARSLAPVTNAEAVKTTETQPVQLPSGTGGISPTKLFPGTDDSGDFDFGPSVSGGSPEFDRDFNITGRALRLPNGQVEVVPTETASKLLRQGATVLDDSNPIAPTNGSERININPASNVQVSPEGGTVADPVDQRSLIISDDARTAAAPTRGIRFSEPASQVTQPAVPRERIAQALAYSEGFLRDARASGELDSAQLQALERQLSIQMDEALRPENNPWRQSIARQIDNLYSDPNSDAGLRSRIEARAINILGENEAMERITDATRKRGILSQGEEDEPPTFLDNFKEMQGVRESLRRELDAIDKRLASGLDENGADLTQEELDTATNRRGTVSAQISMIDRMMAELEAGQQGQDIIDSSINPNEAGFGGGTGAPIVDDAGTTNRGVDPNSPLGRRLQDVSEGKPTESGRSAATIIKEMVGVEIPESKVRSLSDIPKGLQLKSGDLVEDSELESEIKNQVRKEAKRQWMFGLSQEEKAAIGPQLRHRIGSPRTSKHTNLSNAYAEMMVDRKQQAITQAILKIRSADRNLDAATAEDLTQRALTRF